MISEVQFEDVLSSNGTWYELRQLVTFVVREEPSEAGRADAEKARTRTPAASCVSSEYILSYCCWYERDCCQVFLT